MYEKLYEPLKDTEAYLSRINMGKSVVVPDKETLDAIIYAHQCSIAFENLDVNRYKKNIELDTESLFNKIIKNKRGGYCFELNNIFYSLLKALKYDIYPCMVKVCKENEIYVPALHRGSIVKFPDGFYYCDVGFGGPMPAGAVKFEENTLQNIRGEYFRFHQENEHWWILSRIDGRGIEENVMKICVNPAAQEDFIALNHLCSCHSQKDFNFFTDNTMANIRTPNGHYSILNDIFIQEADGVRTESKISSDSELIKLLREKFDIHIEE